MTRISSKLTYNLLTGGLNNVDSIETINQSTKRTETPDIKNIEYFQLGGIKTMEGNTQLGDTQPSTVVGGWEYTKNGHRYMMIALLNGDIKIYNPITEVFDLVYTFPSQSDRVSFCNMNNGVVITNGIDDLVFYEYDRKQAIVGTVDVDMSDATKLTGTNTQFTYQLNKGDEVYVGEYETPYKIEEVVDDTHLVLQEPLPPATEINNYYGWYKYNNYNTNYLVTPYSSSIDKDTGILPIVNGSTNVRVSSSYKLSFSSLASYTNFQIPASSRIKLVFTDKPSNQADMTMDIVNSTNVVVKQIFCDLRHKYIIPTHFRLTNDPFFSDYGALELWADVSDDGVNYISFRLGYTSKSVSVSSYLKELKTLYASCNFTQFNSLSGIGLNLNETTVGGNRIGIYPANRVYSKNTNTPQDIDKLFSITGEEGSYNVTPYDYTNYSYTKDGTFTITHNGVTEEYRRSSIDDKEIEETTPRVNLSIYHGPITQCNATLVNEDDEDFKRPIRGRAINFYNGRLWVGGKDGLFYSQVGQYNKWDIKQDAGVIGEVYNDTSEVRALGLYSEYLMVHKELYTYILTCQGEGKTIAIKPYSNVTCNSQQSFIVSNTKYFVYSVDHMDIYPLMQHTIFADKFLGEPITQKVRNIFLKLRVADLDKVFFVSHPKKRWMIAYLPLVDKLGSGYGLVYDFQTKSFLVRDVPQEVTIAFNYDGNVYLGTKDGLVLKEFDSLYFNGETINAYYKSPWFDWADGYTHSFSEFAIEIANDHNNEFYIRTFKDGASPFEDRIITSDLLTGESLVWDGIEGQDLPDNDTYWAYPEIDLENEDIGDDWVEGTFNHIRMLLPNNVFDKFQLEIGTNQLGQAFAIYGYGFRRIETDEAPW